MRQSHRNQPQCRRVTLAIVMFALTLVVALAALPGAFASPSPAAQKITYQPSDENFPNPERGFYIQRAPIWRADERGPLDKDDLLRARSQGMSMVRTYYLLEVYRDKPLAQSVLDQLKTDFATARNVGVKLVVRFSYNFGTGEADAPVARVQEHIDQLKPVLQANADVIAFMEAGFIGAWGEWHSSTNNLIGPDGVNDNTRAITNKLLATLPATRTIAVRTPQQKRQLTSDETPLNAQEAYRNTPKARIGAHNDCFLASRTDWGTYPEDDAGIEAAKQFLHQDNLFLPQGGETCNDAADAQPYIGCQNALAELARMRWSTINSDYQEQVLNRWKTEGCYSEVERRLGYRFRLLSADIPTSAAPNTTFTASVQMANDGFARPYNQRGLELTLRNKASNAITRLPVETGDTRLFLPGPGETKTLTLTAKLPNTLAAGSYEVLLNLPDPAPGLAGRAEYSIRLANKDLWEPATGYNKLNATVEVKAAAPASAGVYVPLVFGTGGSTPPPPGATTMPSPAPNPTATPPSGITPDPNFLGPFCTDGENPTIIGFDTSAGAPNPTKEEVRRFSLDAVNFLRWRTGLPPLKADAALDNIAERALAANNGHGYFLANCMNAAHNYGRNCEAGWAQENIGGASGSKRTWKDGIRVPLCAMMEEPKGQGHRGNIESKEWTRIGIAASYTNNGAYWFHEFGR